jgi:hypothetical protein
MNVAFASTLGSSALLLNSGGLFNLLNIFEIYNYIPLYQVNLTSLVIEVINSFNTDKFTPNIMVYIVPSQDGIQLSGKYPGFGINTNLFLINAGIYIASFILLIFSFIPVLLMTKLCHPWVKKKFEKIEKSYKYKYFARFFIQSFLDIGIFSLVGIFYFGTENVILIVDMAISLLALSYEILGVALLVYLIRKKYMLRINSEEFKERWEPFFEESKNISGINFYPLLFLIRRIAIALIITLITDKVLQIALSFGTSLMVISI